MADAKYFVDLETVVYLIDNVKTNYSISEFGDFVDKCDIFTDSKTRRGVRKHFDCNWGGPILEDIEVCRRFRSFDDLVASLAENCSVNGYDLNDRNFIYKLELIAHAKHLDAKILTVDFNLGEYSMKNLCDHFGVEVVNVLDFDFST